MSQSIYADLNLHTLGWKAFQDLGAAVCEQLFKAPVEVFRDAQDGGQDGVLSIGRPGGDRIITIQCKFTSKQNLNLKKNDISGEFNKIADLVKIGTADEYILLTNFGIDAPLAAEIRTSIKSLGVKRVRIFGREFLTRVIKANQVLRAMVPRIYGIGDLSLILDSRKAEQTKRILGQWLSQLKYYVSTDAHKKAVRSISAHGNVLLLGNPATGKSTIATVLATIACERKEDACFQLDGPHEFRSFWNPNEKGRFYWIDDAFGSNQLREDYVEEWIRIFPKMHAALDDGNKFVLTSRTHIYNQAVAAFGNRNFPDFQNRKTIVEVGNLNINEKMQILYNHIKLGNQSKSWKSRAKPFLPQIAQQREFIPGIARQLGDKAFTRDLKMTQDAFIDFTQNVKAHLITTINSMSKEHQAALAYIFSSRGRVSYTTPDRDIARSVCNAYGVDPAKLTKSMRELEGSFISTSEDKSNKFWIFSHPTISDAFTTILRQDVVMAEVFIRGAEFSTILQNIICEDMPAIQDTLSINAEMNKLVINRIKDQDDNLYDNTKIFNFLSRRASDIFLRELFAEYPQMFFRKTWNSARSVNDGNIITLARLFFLGVLPNELREKAEQYLNDKLIQEYDTSWLENELILGLLKPKNVLTLLDRARKSIKDNMTDSICHVAEEAESDADADSLFDDFEAALIDIDDLSLADDEHWSASAEYIREYVSDKISEVKEKQQEKAEEKEIEDEYWRSRALSSMSRSRIGETHLLTNNEPRSRSIFSDVQE